MYRNESVRAKYWSLFIQQKEQPHTDECLQPTLLAEILYIVWHARFKRPVLHYPTAYLIIFKAQKENITSFSEADQNG